MSPDYPNTENALLSAYSANDLPSVEALVRYLHAAFGLPVKSTWIKAIKAGNFSTWPGLTYSNAAKYYPESSETIKAHIVQSIKNVRSTNTPTNHLYNHDNVSGGTTGGDAPLNLIQGSTHMGKTADKALHRKL